MKKEATAYCDRVDPKLTSKDLIRQVEDQKGIITKELEVQKSVAECLGESLIGACKEVDASGIDLETQNAIAAKIQDITVKKCVDDEAMHYCKQVDLSSTDKETENSVLKAIASIEEDNRKEVLIKKEESFKKLIKLIEESTGGNKQALIEFKKLHEDNYQPAIDFMSDLRSRSTNKDTDISDKALNICHRMTDAGISKANAIVGDWRAQKETKSKAARTSKQAALREICEAGAEYSRDGYGTQAQIAHELAYWVIDLYKQTGGAASEGQLRTAGSHGYMYENCSKY